MPVLSATSFFSFFMSLPPTTALPLNSTFFLNMVAAACMYERTYMYVWIFVCSTLSCSLSTGGPVLDAVQRIARRGAPQAFLDSHLFSQDLVLYALCIFMHTHIRGRRNLLLPRWPARRCCTCCRCCWPLRSRSRHWPPLRTRRRRNSAG